MESGIEEPQRDGTDGMTLTPFQKETNRGRLSTSRQRGLFSLMVSVFG